MDTFNPEQVLSLSDNEIVQQIAENDQIAQYLDGLQVEIYRDDTLKDVRAALMSEAINPSSVDRESVYPLAFDQKQVIDIRVRVLAKVRSAIKRAIPDISSLLFEPERRHQLQSIIRRTKDGDLAYRYGDIDRDGGTYLAGEDTVSAIFDWKPHFSPELQLKAVKDYDTSGMSDQNALIMGILAQEGELTLEAWRALLERDDEETYRAIWNTKDTRPEVLKMIKENERFRLLFEALTNEQARQEVVRRAAEYHDPNIATWIKY